MSAHTPGPWVAGFDRLPSGKRLFPHVQINVGSDTDDNCISVRVGGTLDACDANARLIAAAPELLQVLETTLSNIKSIKIPGVRVYDKWQEVVERVIAKAKGEVSP